jgi:hypothetical protein
MSDAKYRTIEKLENRIYDQKRYIRKLLLKINSEKMRLSHMEAILEIKLEEKINGGTF